MTGAYPATTTYSSPAFVNSPKAASTTAPAGASKGRFWRKQQPAGPAPMAAGAAGAAATSQGTQGVSNPGLNTVPANAQGTSATGPMGTAAAPNGTSGAFAQRHEQPRGTLPE